jgi:hypothetical protein
MAMKKLKQGRKKLPLLKAKTSLIRADPSLQRRKTFPDMSAKPLFYTRS